MVRAEALVLLLVLALGCDERRIANGGTVPRDGSASSSDGSASGGDGSTSDGMTDGGRMNRDASTIDAGPCAFPASQGLSAPCCPSRGIDACGAALFCEALDGRTQPTCYAEGSRLDGQSCTGDVQCTRGRCDPGTQLCGAGGRFDTVAKILAYLDQKTLVMQGAAIPSHPFGYSEDINYGQATQCYQRIEWTLSAGRLHTLQVFATLQGAPSPGQSGTCDHVASGNTIESDTTDFAITNVQGDGECFDIEVTYPAYAFRGRGRITGGGFLAQLELFFNGQATGARCAEGAPGSPTVTLMGAAFSGDAVQQFEIGR